MDSHHNWLFQLCHIQESECSLIVLPRGKRLDVQDQVALVCDGSIKVSTNDANGGTLLLNQVGEGGLFGVSNLFLDAVPPTTIQASVKSTLALVRKDLVRFRLRENPKAMEAYARFCNEKLQFLLERLNSLDGPCAHDRLLRFIQTHAHGGAITIANKQSLGRALGMSRATLFRELADLEKQGLLTPTSTKTYAVDKSAFSLDLEESS